MVTMRESQGDENNSLCVTVIMKFNRINEVMRLS